MNHARYPTTEFDLWQMNADLDRQDRRGVQHPNDLATAWEGPLPETKPEPEKSDVTEG